MFSMWSMLPLWHIQACVDYLDCTQSVLKDQLLQRTYKCKCFAIYLTISASLAGVYTHCAWKGAEAKFCWVYVCVSGLWIDRLR